MGISVRWHDTEETIQIFEVESPWTINDMYEVIDEGYRMSQHKPHFDIIYDLRNSRTMPPNFRATIGYMSRMKQPQVELRIIVGMGRIISLALILVKALKRDLVAGIVQFDTLEEAIRYIYTQRTQEE